MTQGPSSAQAEWKFGNLEPRNLEMLDPKNQKMKVLKIKIRVTQNVGKVWITTKKLLQAPFGVISDPFFHGPKKYKKPAILVYFPWWANTPYSHGFL